MKGEQYILIMLRQASKLLGEACTVSQEFDNEKYNMLGVLQEGLDDYIVQLSGQKKKNAMRFF